jgi:hypothetical protein
MILNHKGYRLQPNKVSFHFKAGDHVVVNNYGDHCHLLVYRCKKDGIQKS